MGFSNPAIAHWIPVLSGVTRATLKLHSAQNRNSHRANSRSRTRGSRARSNSFVAIYSFSVNGLGICSTYRLTCAAISGCPWRLSVSLTASHARRTSSRVRISFALPDSTCSLPCTNSCATALTRFWKWVDSPRDSRAIDAVWLARARYTADVPRRRVCGYPQCPKMVCEPLSPFPERGFANVQPLPLIACGLDETRWTCG